MNSSKNKTVVYFPEIDGLRGLAVVMVLLFHFNEHFFPFGWGGVDIFFVISGFVVTRSFTRSYKAHDTVKVIIDFYLRRIIRQALILPFRLLTLMFGKK